MTSPDEPGLTAAELALGVLDGDERAAALRRVLADPLFAREVERWRSHFAALYAEVPAVEPRKALEQAAVVFPRAGRRDERQWRVVAMIAGIAAAVLFVLVVVRPERAPITAPAVAKPVALLAAVLKPEGGEPIAAVFDTSTREVRLRGAIKVGPDRDAELWTIGTDGVPHAAGLLARASTFPLRVRRDIVVASGTTLAVSIEPVGGSPKSGPTGPIVATGTLATI